MYSVNCSIVFICFYCYIINLIINKKNKKKPSQAPAETLRCHARTFPPSMLGPSRKIIFWFLFVFCFVCGFFSRTAESKLGMASMLTCVTACSSQKSHQSIFNGRRKIWLAGKHCGSKNTKQLPWSKDTNKHINYMFYIFFWGCPCYSKRKINRIPNIHFYIGYN